MVIDPVAGRIAESRVGKGDGADPALARWGAAPAAPVCGLGWLAQFRHVSARLSLGLETDREWYALHYTSCLIRGFCDLAVIREALAGEGVHPVGAVGNGVAEPRAMATLWFNVIHDSVCGRYHEVVLSFDASHGARDAMAFRTDGDATWALQYANFGPSACETQFLHSLWIDSPLSIAWGREMQGFPKHPDPVASTITDGADAFVFDLRWDGRPVLAGRAGKRFGAGGFVRESLGLVGAHGPLAVTRFLARSSFEIPITMPERTATHHGVPRRYVGHLWKGLSPVAVQVWPWAADDTLTLGAIERPTGCEAHNGHALLQRAGFRPAAVTYLASAAAVVVPA